MAIYDYETLHGFDPASVDPDKYRLKRKFSGNPKVAEYQCEYGLSQFKLKTFDGDTAIECVGVLEEMPEFSFTVDYTDGPGVLWQDMLQQFMTNDLFNLVNAIGSASTGSGWKNLLQGGSWTKKIYNGYNPGTIPLKFKIFSADSLRQSTPQHWIDCLSKYAAISNKNTFTFEQAGTNIFTGLSNVSGTSKKAVSETIKILNKDNEPEGKKEQTTYEEDKEKARKEKDELDEYLKKFNLLHGVVNIVFNMIILLKNLLLLCMNL